MTEKGSKTIERQDLKVAWGDKIEPLGFDRFKTCELMAELLHCSNMGLLNERGSEEEVRSRDAEREQLKAQGKLATPAAIEEQPSTTDFSTSIDSSGFHHEDEYVSLSRSPHESKGMAAQNTGDEDGFEKVAMPDAQEAFENPDATDSLALRVSETPQVHLKEISSGSSGNLSDEESTSPTMHVITSQVADLDLDQNVDADPMDLEPSDKGPQSPSKSTSSLLSQQLQAEKEGISSRAPKETIDEENIYSSDAPAPLFSTNPFSQTSKTTTAVGSVSEGDTPKSGDIGGEDDESPVVGDLLKIMFVKNKVVPIILVCISTCC